MRLGKRIGLLIRANLGSWRRDKDPGETALRRADKMEALLEQLGERLNRALARQAQLEGQLRQAEEMAGQWEHRVDEALRAGDETAAREAVRHKLAYAQAASELGSSLARETAAITGIQADLTKLESRLARVREKSRIPSPATESQLVSGNTTTSVAVSVTGKASPAGEAAGNLDALGERMSRVWSDTEIEGELDAIKSRLSAGHSAGTG
ncbi:MAG: PspA/IM30 family protein [Anaerolineae bacterium]|nr:PspA/IM30 family protein [Anaerolineae bacterium]